jgi:hypothetical protein
MDNKSRLDKATQNRQRETQPKRFERNIGQGEQIGQAENQSKKVSAGNVQVILTSIAGRRYDPSHEITER